MNPRVIAYPIETTNRELDGVLLLAGKLARRGCTVFTGPIFELDQHIGQIKPNIYVTTRAEGGSDVKALWNSLKRSGSKIVVADTEGGVFWPDEYSQRHSKSLTRLVDCLITWGREGEAVLRKVPYFSSVELATLGCSWFDLDELAPAYDKAAAELLEKHGGRFILFNSRFAEINPAEGRPVYPHPNNQLDLEIRDRLAKLVHQAAIRNPQERFIVRPHPAEGENFWIDYFRELTNVKIEKTLPVRAYIRAAKLVLHHGCTTAIEAAMMKCPVATFVGEDECYRDSLLPNQIGIPVRNLDDFLRLIPEGTSLQIGLTDREKSLVAGFIRNIESSATESIANKLCSLDHGQFRLRTTPGYLFALAKSRLVWGLPDKLLRFLPWVGKKIARIRGYGYHKFRDFSEHDLREFFAATDEVGKEIEGLVFRKVPGTKHCWRISTKPL